MWDSAQAQVPAQRKAAQREESAAISVETIAPSSAAILVTGIAVHAVIHVAGNSGMPGIGCCRGVATGAGEDRVIRGVCVACSANTIRIAVVQREEGVVAGR